MNGWGKSIKCKCKLPNSAKLGATLRCEGCGQVWKYTHDNVASCFWVHAGPFKRLAHRLTEGS